MMASRHLVFCGIDTNYVHISTSAYAQVHPLFALKVLRGINRDFCFTQKKICSVVVVVSLVVYHIINTRTHYVASQKAKGHEKHMYVCTGNVIISLCCAYR